MLDPHLFIERFKSLPSKGDNLGIRTEIPMPAAGPALGILAMVERTAKDADFDVFLRDFLSTRCHQAGADGKFVGGKFVRKKTGR